ncbi:MAG: VWA domain-containing protein [Candidatus Omnitrophica bacterium]|nr:VWA domain-containing protein [Candidatus Omnitrophota bacterium]
MRIKVRKRIWIALWASILMHIGFLVWSYFVKILPAIPFPERPETVFHVKIDRQESMGLDKLKFDTQSSHKALKPDSNFTNTMESKPLIESEELIKNNIESSVQKSKQALVPSSIHEDQILRKSQLNDLVMTKKVRHSVRENLVELGEVPDENFSSGAPVLNSGEDISRNFLDKSAIPANAYSAAPLKTANTQREFQMMKKSSSGIEHESQGMDMGTALTYQLFKYKDPVSGHKYFKLAVKVRDATINFPVIPKEIIFLVDASGSIGMKRLAQFEEGLIYSLKHLNPGDRFNIFVFKDKSIAFSPTSLKPDGNNIKNAVEFLQGLKSWSTTDIYNALRTCINLKDPFVPSYRVFMSDGFPTTGIIDARRVINEISKINDNKVSIFTFGGGVSVDPYMLDFIAFKNRGWSTVVDREPFMGREFSRFYDEIKDPLLLNVRYYVSGLNDKEIFPQTMPDFFKGSQFVIYGRYTNENKFVIQIRGDMAKDKKEFIVSAFLKDALAADKQVAHDWAFHKVYYLISQLKYNENNQSLIDEIGNLCAKFHIITPYSIRKMPPKHLIRPQLPHKENKAVNLVVKK